MGGVTRRYLHILEAQTNYIPLVTRRVVRTGARNPL